MRRVVTGALELERAAKRIGSSLEAAPVVYVSDPDLFAALVDVDLAEVSITSAATLVEGEGPADAFRLDDVRGRRGGAEARRRHGNARARGKSRPASAPIPTIPTSRRATRRRCANGTRSPRRRSNVLREYLWGPLTRFGVVVALIVCAIDQAVQALAAVSSSTSPIAASSTSRRSSTSC